MQQHLPFFGLHTLAMLPHCKLSPPHLSWLLAAPACGAIDSNISTADSVTISIRMIWLPSPPSAFQSYTRSRKVKAFQRVVIKPTRQHTSNMRLVRGPKYRLTMSLHRGQQSGRLWSDCC